MRNWSRGIARNLPHQLPLEIYNDAQLVCMKRGYILLQSKFWAFFINTSPTFAQNIGLSKENHVHTSKCIEDEGRTIIWEISWIPSQILRSSDLDLEVQ